MSEINGQEGQEQLLPDTAEPSLKFRLPETEDLDLFVVVLEDGTKVVRTAEELEVEEASDL